MNHTFFEKIKMIKECASTLPLSLNNNKLFFNILLLRKNYSYMVGYLLIAFNVLFKDKE